MPCSIYATTNQLLGNFFHLDLSAATFSNFSWKKHNSAVVDIVVATLSNLEKDEETMTTMTLMI